MELRNTSKVPAILKQARWIWPESEHWDLHNCYALFRKSFRLSQVPDKAPLFITADQSYQLYINGHYVCRGPARGFQKNWPYDEIDLRSWLIKGENLIAIRAHNPGFGNFQYISQGYAGLLLAANWGNTTIVSDDSWKCRRQAGIRRDTVPTSLQLFAQESIDLNIENPDWMLPSFDDQLWDSIIPSAKWNAMPWYSLESRGLPMLDEQEIRIGQVIGEAMGESAPDYLVTRDLSLTRFEEGLAHKTASSDAQILSFDGTQKDCWRSQLIDLGKLHVGSVLLEIGNAQGGEIVETHHYETIEPTSLCPDYNPSAHCRMAFSHRLICRPGKNHHAFYHPFGFRYMVVTVRNNPAKLTVTPSLRTTVYPFEQKGAFTSSENSLNDIWRTCAWTQRVCSLDAFVDTPWREQAQWWGDARVQAWNTFHLSGDTRLFRRGISQIAQQTTPDGVTYGHAPTIAHNCILPDFTIIWMLTIWDHYWQTGSTEALLSHHSTVQHALDYFRSKTDPDSGLVVYDGRFWLFLDWTELFKDGAPALYNLWLLLALEKLAELYRVAGMTADAESLAAWAHDLRVSLAKLVGEDGLIRDGFDFKGKRIEQCSIHSQILALQCHLDGVDASAVEETLLLPLIREEIKPKTYPSAYWITYVFSYLGERGYGAEVIDFIKSRWSPMVEHGTTWETFNPLLGTESRSHAWSAHPLFHFMQIVGGIQQTAPEWKRIRFCPTFYGEHSKTVIPTPNGLIESAWEKQPSGKIQVVLKLPVGVEAEVQFPGVETVDVLGSSEWEITIPSKDSIPG